MQIAFLEKYLELPRGGRATLHRNRLIEDLQHPEKYYPLNPDLGFGGEHGSGALSAHLALAFQAGQADQAASFVTGESFLDLRFDKETNCCDANCNHRITLTHKEKN